SAGNDGTLRIWDPRSGDNLLSIDASQHGIRACAFSPDGAAIASVGDDGTLRIRDPRSGDEVPFRIHYLGHGQFAVLARDGTRILQTSPEAWRWLGWLGTAPDGRRTRYPAEIFGPLPVVER
ncbi:WD40 repeat domain-containing protein, partial [Endothiovibrio diazotrophicus]